MTQFLSNRTPCGRTRREFFWQFGGGFASLPLIHLLSTDGFFDGFFDGRSAAAESGLPVHPAVPVARPHFVPRAKRVVFFFMQGGPSQVDTFEPETGAEKI